MPSSEYYYDPDPSDFDEEPHEVTCKYCGARGLWWFPEKRGRYFLKNQDGTQHNCLRVPASPDEFDLV